MGVSMSVCKFDTFENETEISLMIKKSQDKSLEYLKAKDPWDIQVTRPLVLQEK